MLYQEAYVSCLKLPGRISICSRYRNRMWYRASRSSVNTLSTCLTRKRMSADCNDRDVLSCAFYTGVKPGTGHLVRQLTHCPPALPVSVVLILTMTETYCHVLSVKEQKLVKVNLFFSEKLSMCTTRKPRFVACNS
jgi:hypothetical protein